MMVNAHGSHAAYMKDVAGLSKHGVRVRHNFDKAYHSLKVSNNNFRGIVPHAENNPSRTVGAAERLRHDAKADG